MVAPREGPFDPAKLWRALRAAGYSEHAATNTVDEHIRRARLAMQADAPETMGAGLAAAQGFSQGATLGFGDEAAGAVAALPRLMPGGVSPKSAYMAARDRARAVTAQALADQPLAFSVGAAAGTAPAFAAAAGSPLLAGLSPAATGALAGGAVGAAQGAGMSDGDLTSRALGALQGGVVGGVTGGAAGAAVGAAAPITRQIGRNLRRIRVEADAEARAAFQATLEAAGVKEPALTTTLNVRFPPRRGAVRTATSPQQEAAQRMTVSAAEARRQAALARAAADIPDVSQGSSLAIRTANMAEQQAAKTAAAEATQAAQAATDAAAAARQVTNLEVPAFIRRGGEAAADVTKQAKKAPRHAPQARFDRVAAERVAKLDDETLATVAARATDKTMREAALREMFKRKGTPLP